MKLSQRGTADRPTTPMSANWILRDYVCSVCWQSLVERCYDGAWSVECGVYGREHAGFHRFETATRSRQESSLRLQEFKTLYRKSDFAEMLGLTDHRTPEEILAYGRRALGRDDGGIF